MKFGFSLGVFLVLFAGSFSFVSAATIYIDPGTSTIFRGDAITTSVRLMPDKDKGECVNAVDAVITYSSNIQPVDVSIGRSIFNVWIESPVINKENRTITFAGGIPNGYCGRVEGDPGLTNVIVDIIFRSPGFQIGIPNNDNANENVAVIEFLPETSAYLNDGQGTKSDLRTLSSTINLEKTAGPGVVDDWRLAVQQDDFPPEEFSISLATDTAAFGGDYFIVFSTTDKQTGISHYEIIEEPSSEFGRFTWGATDAPWVRVTSPYKLKDQSLNSIIRIKAFDKAGNEYIATLLPAEDLRVTSEDSIVFYILIGAGTLLLVILMILVYIIYKRRKKSDSENSNQTESEVI